MPALPCIHPPVGASFVHRRTPQLPAATEPSQDGPPGPDSVCARSDPNLDNHFTVDPDKFDFYAMDCCYRRTGEDAMATMQAEEVIRKTTAPDGSLRAPMRVAEAHTNLGVASARGATSTAP